MKILITGGAGYIGSVLIPILLEKDFEITVLDNFIFNQPFSFKNNKLKLIKGDVRDIKLMDKIIKDDFDYIIPLAGLVGAPLCEKKPQEAKDVNETAADYLCKYTDINTKIIVPTSNSGYGIGKKNVFCTEESPLNPISIYGVKSECREINIIERKFNFSWATVFGYQK